MSNEQRISSAPDKSRPGDAYFVTTRWTMVLHAGSKSTPGSDRALEDLCRAYWQPLYAFVRRKGYSREQAEDLTQAFFERFLARNYLRDLQADKGRFRAFLLACLKHFLANEQDKANRQKRGGTAETLSLDWTEAEGKLHLDLPDNETPDRQYDREWALAVLERVVARLQSECESGGKSDLFKCARMYLTVSEDALPYGDAAKQLGMDEGTVRVAVHRLRKRYREILREEIAQTLIDPSGVEEEMASLRSALSRAG